MKLHILVICTLVLSTFAMCGAADTPPKPLATDKDKVSYSIGAQIGGSLKKQGVEVDTDALMRGLKDALGGTQLALSDTEMQQTMEKFQKEMVSRQQAETAKAAEQNKAAGQKFLAENKAKEGVQTTASGLQYKVIQNGNGPKPQATDTIKAHYRGTTIDGKEFDSSYKRGEPAVFPVNGVIKGWTEAVQLMPVGSKWQLFIPSDLAYGERGAGDVIGPNQTLVFEVELIGIEPKQQQQPQEQKQ